jgi:hypothetical protein
MKTEYCNTIVNGRKEVTIKCFKSTEFLQLTQHSEGKATEGGDSL